jgi:hypothetical protein
MTGGYLRVADENRSAVFVVEKGHDQEIGIPADAFATITLCNAQGLGLRDASAVLDIPYE